MEELLKKIAAKAEKMSMEELENIKIMLKDFQKTETSTDDKGKITMLDF